MEDKLLKLLGSLDFTELQKVKRDLDSGSLLFKHIVNQKIAEVEHSDRHVCASCGAMMSKEKHEVYTLLFGAQSIRKKASFCGTDCLQDFLEDIRDTSKRRFIEDERILQRKE